MFVTLLNSLKVTNYIPKKIVNKEMSDKYKHTEASNKYSGHAHSQNLYTSSLFLGMVKTCYFPLSLYPKPLVWLIGLVECLCTARFLWVMYTTVECSCTALFLWVMYTLLFYLNTSRQQSTLNLFYLYSWVLLSTCIQMQLCVFSKQYLMTFSHEIYFRHQVKQVGG